MRHTALRTRTPRCPTVVCVQATVPADSHLSLHLRTCFDTDCAPVQGTPPAARSTPAHPQITADYVPVQDTPPAYQHLQTPKSQQTVCLFKTHHQLLARHLRTPRLQQTVCLSKTRHQLINTCAPPDYCRLCNCPRHPTSYSTPAHPQITADCAPVQDRLPPAHHRHAPAKQLARAVGAAELSAARGVCKRGEVRGVVLPW